MWCRAIQQSLDCVEWGWGYGLCWPRCRIGSDHCMPCAACPACCCRHGDGRRDLDDSRRPRYDDRIGGSRPFDDRRRSDEERRRPLSYDDRQRSRGTYGGQRSRSRSPSRRRSRSRDRKRERSEERRQQQQGEEEVGVGAVLCACSGWHLLHVAGCIRHYLVTTCVPAGLHPPQHPQHHTGAAAACIL